MLNKKSFFINGKIDPLFISHQISKHQTELSIGAHSIFLGQVRADEKNKRYVQKIIYSAYLEMAETEINKIREKIISQFNLKCLHIYHSLGEIYAGEVSIFVFGSSSHRQNIFTAIQETVDEIKNNVPIWKKEILIDTI